MVRIILVLGTIPAIFGQIMASYVVTQLAELQVHMEPIVNFDTDHYRVLHQRLIEHEELVMARPYKFRSMLKKSCMPLKNYGMDEVQEIKPQKKLGVECGVLSMS